MTAPVIERYLTARGYKNRGPCSRLLSEALTGAFRGSEDWPGPPPGRLDLSLELNAIIGGFWMEQTNDLLHAANDELRDSRAQFETLHNDLRALRDLVLPLLHEQAQAIRAARMTVVAETQTALAALRDVRRFFLEDDYATEIARLERFVALCREIQALQASGIFEVVVDAALKLAVRETPP